MSPYIQPTKARQECLKEQNIGYFGQALRDVLPVKPQTQVFENNLIRPGWRDLWSLREDTLRSKAVQQVKTLAQKCKELPPIVPGDMYRIQN